MKEKINSIWYLVNLNEIEVGISKFLFFRLNWVAEVIKASNEKNNSRRHSTLAWTQLFQNSGFLKSNIKLIIKTRKKTFSRNCWSFLFEATRKMNLIKLLPLWNCIFGTDAIKNNVCITWISNQQKKHEFALSIFNHQIQQQQQKFQLHKSWKYPKWLCLPRKSI